MWSSRSLFLVGVLLLCSVQGASAGTLGIPLDSFLSQLVLWVVGLGVIIGTIGGASWALQHISAQYALPLGGLLILILVAGFLGGWQIIIQKLGLVAGGLV